MNFVLTCDCGCTDFVHEQGRTGLDPDIFTCQACFEHITEHEAGKHLLATEEVK